MTTPRELLARYVTQSQMSSFFIDKMGIINVKSYGAAGDGVIDDTQAIINGLADSRSKGTSLYFPSGKYKITSSITLQKHDSIIGESVRKTYILPETPGMTCFIFTVQEIEFRNIAFTGSGGTYTNFNAIEMRANNCIIDSVTVYHANRAFNVTAPSYNNVFSNIFAYKVKHGIYCADGVSFNNNKIEFSLCFGTQYPSWQAGDIGIRLIGTSNEINGGEWAGFDIAFEIVGGRNNHFLSLWSELNQFSIKNTALTTNIISLSHLTSVHNTGAKLLATENGYGVSGSIKRVGNYGFDVFDRLKSYWIFDDQLADGTFYDYSQNKNHLQVGTLITVTDQYTSYGKVKKFVFDNDRSLYATSPIDFTKPLTVCLNASVTKYPAGNLYGVKAFYIVPNADNNVRLILYDTSFGIEKRVNGVPSFVVNEFNGGLIGDNNLGVVTFDFPNNRILVPDLLAGKMMEYPCDFSGFGANTTNYHIIRHESGTSDTAEVVANYVMMWERTIDMADFFEIAKIKKHTFPLQYLRKVDYQADSDAADVATLKNDFNALLTKLRTSNIMALS